MDFKIKYNVTIPETEAGLKVFFNKYQIKRQIIFTIVYAIAFILGVDLIVKNPASMFGFVIAAFSAGLIAAQWIRPKLVRKRLLRTISELNDEKYTAEFFEDRIEISTEILQNNEQTEIVAISGKGVMPLDSENAEEAAILEPEPIEKTVINLLTETLGTAETDDFFLLFVNKQLMYVFPKRCLEGDQEKLLATYLTEKIL